MKEISNSKHRLESEVNFHCDFVKDKGLYEFLIWKGECNKTVI